MFPERDDIIAYERLQNKSAGKEAIGQCGRGLTYRMCSAIKQARKHDAYIKGISIADVIYLNDPKMLAQHNDIGPKTLAHISIVREKIHRLVNSNK